MALKKTTAELINLLRKQLSHFLPLTGFISEWGALFYLAVAGAKRVACSARGHVQQLQPYLYNLIRDY